MIYYDKAGISHCIDLTVRNNEDYLDLKGMVASPVGSASNSNFAGCDLRGSNFDNTIVTESNFRNADLRGATFKNADMEGCDLRGAKLDGANFYYSFLKKANFEGCDLRKVKFEGATLRGVRMAGAQLPDFQIPQDRELIVWKALAATRICQLRIPKEAKRTGCLRSKKCRAEYAEVLKILLPNGDGWEEVYSGMSAFDYRTSYRVGEIVRPNSYNGEAHEECVNGIHFFMSRHAAENY